MVETSSAPGPGVIVIAERPIADLLASQGIGWVVQERQPSIAAMWDALSGGQLDQRSRILVFSDSLQAGSGTQDSELLQTSRAIVAMSNAGAHVFVAVWRPDDLPHLRQLIAAAAAGQGLEPDDVTYHLLQMADGGRAVLDAMRIVLADEVAFPDDYRTASQDPMVREAFVPSGIWTGPRVPSGHDAPEEQVVPIVVATAHDPSEDFAPPLPPIAVATRPNMPVRPAMPPLGSASSEPETTDGYPPMASRDLLNRPKLPGQMTITVTSSKGGSGKSTASILLAGSVARASREAGHPLSVCLVDLDTRDGQVASLIGKFMPTALNIRVQPVWDEERIRRNLVRAEGLEVDTLLAPIRPRTADTVGPDFYRAIVRSLQRMYDVIIMDTSVQYLEPLIADVALGEADEVLFVTTLASTAVQGMARALREITAPVDESGLGIPREKIGIIVNQSVANVGMERDQVLAAGLGVPVVGVIPLATKDVLTATNLNRMHALLDHPLIGPAYNELARACLPGRALAPWHGVVARPSEPAPPTAAPMTPTDSEDSGRRRGLFRR